MNSDTLLQHLGEEVKVRHAVVQPLFQNSLFLYDTWQEFRQGADNQLNDQCFYSRVGNPTLDLAEKKIAALEGTDRCKLVGSGMAAISTAILACVKQNDHVVTIDTVYGPVRDFLTNYLARFGITVSYVDGTCVEEIFDAVQDNTSLIYLESPSSMVFHLQDLKAIGAFAKQRGIATVIDNTYSTPLLQQPAKFGIDFVVHSASKYLGGHSDVIAGAVCCSHENMARITPAEVALLGNILAPFPAWLIIRGMRTLSVRLRHHEKTANEVAGWLTEQPWVGKVNHISLPSHPQYALYRSQMSGSGGLFSFEPADPSEEKAIQFVNALENFGIGVSWGGFESLVVQAEIKYGPENKPHRVIRMFTGLEDVNDLIADIANAAKIAYA